MLSLILKANNEKDLNMEQKRIDYNQKDIELISNKVYSVKIQVYDQEIDDTIFFDYPDDYPKISLYNITSDIEKFKKSDKYNDICNKLKGFGDNYSKYLNDNKKIKNKILLCRQTTEITSEKKILIVNLLLIKSKNGLILIDNNIYEVKIEVIDQEDHNKNV